MGAILFNQRSKNYQISVKKFSDKHLVLNDIQIKDCLNSDLNYSDMQNCNKYDFSILHQNVMPNEYQMDRFWNVLDDLERDKVFGKMFHVVDNLIKNSNYIMGDY